MRHPGQAQRVRVGAVDPAWARLRGPQDCDCVPQLKAALKPAVPLLMAKAEAAQLGRPALPRRRRIWELGGTLHCSIIGTCLSTDELRRLLRKLGFGAMEATDHDLHGTAVGLAGQQDVAAKLLNKTLDERHRIAIRRFEAATDRSALRSLWRNAVEAGDIPGGYWAVLTHPAADRALVAEVFGEVHMLSHLVGAANRADIRRLAEQEREIGALRDTVARQQARLQAELTERDRRIHALQTLLAEQAGQASTKPQAAAADGAATGEVELLSLIADLRRRLERETRRREASDGRAAAAEAASAERRAACQCAEAELALLNRELLQAEAALAPEVDAAAAAARLGAEPRGTVLYVGGRSGQTALLRQAAARFGAELVHHDAEQGAALLPGLVGRADLVVFPVDCVSHDAALSVKRLCRQVGRHFLPLRSSGVTSLLAALAGPLPCHRSSSPIERPMR